jgi:diguanylate cyclase (GGDEF)-like protein
MAAPAPLVCLDPQALDRLMPMHLVILPSGHISQAAPTLQKLCPNARLVGRRFLEVFEIRRPRRPVMTARDLRALAGTNLRLQFRKNPQSVLKAILVGLPDDAGYLVNLSFGLSVIEAVREYDLTNGDFAPTDLAIEMLYLVEAKTAVMDESRRLNERLQGARLAAEEQASTDMLTGLRNRRAMDQSLAELTAQGKQFALMHLDLDYFKAVNDTHGHAAGDHVLQAAAQVLLDETRQGDTVARVGGDEFVLIFPDLVDETRLARIANRIVTRLEEPVEFQGKTCRISGSIGFTTSRLYAAPDLDQMLSDADLALYASKHKGRACTTMVTPDLLKASRDRRDHAPDRRPETAPRDPP